MQQAFSTSVQSSNFDLKKELVELIPAGAESLHVTMSIGELEAMRTAGVAVPASRNGLEVICGASCETSAQ